MAEYIERETASNKLYDVYEYVKRNIIADGKPVDASLVKNIMLRFEKALNAVPNADVAPVRHGRWLPFHSTAAGDIQYCSACEIGCMWKPNYWPNCGAKMDGGNDD